MRIRSATFQAALLAGVLLAGSTVPASAAGTPSWNVTAGASWLKGHVAHGHVAGISGPDLSATVQTATALAYAGRRGAHVATVLRKMSRYLNAHVDAYVSGGAPASPAVDDPGALARLIFLKQATGTADPARLVARLVATQQPSGLFGTGDPTYDGTIRQSMAMVVLHGAGMGWSDPVMASARAWLLAQQCDGGGFSADAASAAAGCTLDLLNYLGPDTNSTAMALWALSPANGAPSTSDEAQRALAFLQGAERASATWGWLPGLPADSNSSALVVLALAETGTDMTAGTGPWSRRGTSPVDGLERFQVRPLDTPSTAGGFRYQNSATYPTPDMLSTEQALLALSVAGG